MLITRTDGIGDVILTLPLAVALKDGACTDFCIAPPPCTMLTFSFVLLSGGGPSLVVTASKLQIRTAFSTGFI